MADNTYAAWSIHDLKAAAAAAKPAELEHDVTSFADGESAMRGIREQFDAALAELADGWTGTAAQAATTNARAAIATLTDTSQTAAATSGAVVGYAQSVRDAQQAVAAIPDTSFDWGEAFKAGSFAGPVGVGGDALMQAVQAEQHRKRAAELVEQMDHAGRAHADVMRGMPWTRNWMPREAPVALTPPPGGTKPNEAGPSGSKADIASDTAHTSQPRTSEADRSDSRLHASNHRNGAETADPRNGLPGAARDATFVAGGVDMPVAHVAAEAAVSTPGTAANVAVPSAAAAAAAAGGVGVTAGGLVARTTGRVGITAGETGVAPSGPPGDRPATGERPDAGRRGTAERAGGRVEAEPRTASASRSQLSELAMRERGAPAGGYPMSGAAGQQRDDEDELRARPEYLVESDEIWGDGRTAAPPVLG